jgi:hypothetical protein
VHVESEMITALYIFVTSCCMLLSSVSGVPDVNCWFMYEGKRLRLHTKSDCCNPVAVCVTSICMLTCSLSSTYTTAAPPSSVL